MIGKEFNKVDNDLVVTIEYTMMIGKEVLDSSEEEGPLEYLHGHSNIIPGLENALAGMRIGESKHIKVSPEDGYGEREEDAVNDVPRNEFPEDFPLEVGMELEIEGDDDNILLVTVVDVNKDTVTLDTNHPLAGEVLEFDVKVLDLRAALPEELDHGHVHASGYEH